MIDSICTARWGLSASRGMMVLLGVALLPACASLTKAPLGVDGTGSLQPCPSAPRCVSSQALDPARRVAALTLSEPGSGAWESLLQLLDAMPRTVLVDLQPNYVRAEITSPWGVYTDDLELLRQAGQQAVQVRSSARIGYYDFDVNRERVEALREAGIAAGVLRRSRREGPDKDGGRNSDG